MEGAQGAANARTNARDPMKLYSIIASAQGGQVFVNMASAFGLSEDLAAQVVRYFVTPIRKTIEKRTESYKGLLSVLNFLAARRCDRYLTDPRMFGHPKVEEEGKEILNYVFHNHDNIRKVIANRAKMIPVQPDQLEAMFPYVAVMAIGAMEYRTRRPLAGVALRLSGAPCDDGAIDNPYSELVCQLQQREAMAETGKSSGFVGVLGSLFSRSAAGAAPRSAAPAA
jgi:hypothetical protein